MTSSVSAGKTAPVDNRDASAAAECPSGRALPPFYFVVTFWGETFRDWFCQYPLSSLLAPNNIPALARLGIAAESRFLICTTVADWRALQRDPLFKRLKKHVEPEFIPLPSELLEQQKYTCMSVGHRLLLARCFERRAAAVYLAADTVVPDGAVPEIARLIGEKKRIALCTAVRFGLEGVERELVKSGRRSDGEPIVLSNREAVAIGLRNLHPETRAGNWAAPDFGRLSVEHNRQDFLSCCYWEVPEEEGVVILTHNWAPIFIDFSRMDVHDDATLRKWAIDGDYVYRNFHDAKIGEDVHVVSDSDSLFLLGLTPEDEMVPAADRSRWWRSHALFGEWSKGFILNQTAFDRHTDPLRRRIYGTRVRWHAGPVSTSWTPVEAAVDDIADEYLRHNIQAVIGLLAGLRFSRAAIGGKWRYKPVRLFWYGLFMIPRIYLAEFMRPPERQHRWHVIHYHLGKWGLNRLRSDVPRFLRLLRLIFGALRNDLAARAHLSQRIADRISHSAGGPVRAALVIARRAWHVLRALSGDDASRARARAFVDEYCKRYVFRIW